jgi:hypothetical protein
MRKSEISFMTKVGWCLLCICGTAIAYLLLAVVLFGGLLVAAELAKWTVDYLNLSPPRLWRLFFLTIYGIIAVAIPGGISAYFSEHD